MRAAVHQNLLSVNSGRDGLMFDAPVGQHRVTLALPGIPLSGGHYFWSVRMWDADRGTIELDTPFRFPMVITDDEPATGTLSLEHKWSFDEPAHLEAAAVRCATAVPAVLDTMDEPCPRTAHRAVAPRGGRLS